MKLFPLTKFSRVKCELAGGDLAKRGVVRYSAVRVACLLAVAILGSRRRPSRSTCS